MPCQWYIKMHDSRIIYVASYSLLFILISGLFQPVVGKCSKTGPCSCQTEDGGKLDLHPISKTDGTPQFVDIADQSGQDQFSWNPCTPFNEGTARNVMVVQSRFAVPSRFYYSLGTQDSAIFLDTNTGLVLQYSADALKENTLRTSLFTLICDESQEGTLTALGERGQQAIYDFELRSKYACIQGGSTSISAGTVLCIVFVVLVFIYIVGGILFQTFVRKASGKERFPNYDMWRQFPIYLKRAWMAPVLLIPFIYIGIGILRIVFMVLSAFGFVLKPFLMTKSPFPCIYCYLQSLTGLGAGIDYMLFDISLGNIFMGWIDLSKRTTQVLVSCL